MKFINPASFAVAITAAFGTVLPALAFSVTQNNNTEDLLNFLLGNTTGLSNFSVSSTGDAAAFGLFEDDPFGLGQGLVLSTGQVVNLVGENTEDGGEVPRMPDFPNDLSTDFGAIGETDDFISLEISFDADATAESLFFEYIFGSEEFLEFGGFEYNDSFELLLNGTNLATLSDGQTATINNLVPSARGPYHADFISNPAGAETVTKLDGYTSTLRFEGGLNPNERNTLSINIRDVGDGGFDSAVFIRGGSLSTSPPPQSIPEHTGIIGLFVVAGLITWMNRKPQTPLKKKSL